MSVDSHVAERIRELPDRPGIYIFKDAAGTPFGFERKGTAGRWTFVVGPDGKVAYKNTKVVPALDAKAVAAFIAGAAGK